MILSPFHRWHTKTLIISRKYDIVNMKLPSAMFIVSSAIYLADGELIIMRRMFK